MSIDPIKKFKEELTEAENAGIDLANACSLATVTPDGLPDNRMVLLKGADERGFVFYTNLGSSKAVDLESTPHAALCFWWNQHITQIRVRGPVTPVSGEEADDYFATRARGSQLGSWVSKQSEVLESREQLEEAVDELDSKYEDGDVPRPPFWSGYRLNPTHIEFWYARIDRLHDRYLHTRNEDGSWTETRLNP